MPTVFISHSSEDAELIERYILPVLKARGVDVWYSPKSIHTAEEWERSIKRGLESSDWFIVAISPNSAKSRWVRAETGWAFSNREGKIVPILIGQCNPYDLHLLLPDLQFADFRRDPTKGAEELISIWDKKAAGAYSVPAGTPPSPIGDNEVRTGSSELPFGVVYKYISVNRAYLLPSPERVMVYHGIAIQTLTWGERLQLLRRDGEYLHLQAYSGKQGYLLPQDLQDTDPKVYFQATVAGKRNTGFLHGAVDADDPSRVVLKMNPADYHFPVCQIKRLEITPTLIRVTDMDGGKTEADDFCGRLVVGPMQSIKSGTGREVQLTREGFKESLELVRM